MTKIRISQRAANVLEWIDQGLGTHHYCRGQAEHGGRATIVYSLIKKGLLDFETFKLTKAGKEWLKCWREKRAKKALLAPLRMGIRLPKSWLNPSPRGRTSE